METYRVSSTLTESDREYLIQTVNDAAAGSVCTTVFVNGVRTETVTCPHPDALDPEKILALVKLAHGEKKKELELLLRAYRKVTVSGDVSLVYQLGTAFFYKGFFSEARELFAAATRLSPEHHQAFFYLGQASLELGRMDEALAAAAQAVTLRPGFADYRNALGEAHLTAGDWQAAITEFETATTINLYYADAYFNLGLAVLLQLMTEADRNMIPHRINRVTDCLNKAALIDSAYRGELLEKGVAALRAHDFSAAMATLRRVRDEKKERHRRDLSTFHMRFVLHPDWVSDKVLAERIAYLEAEIKKNPNYVDLMAELAHCYLEQARLSWQKGLEQYQKTLDVNPGLQWVQRARDGAEAAMSVINQTLSEASQRDAG